MSSSSTSLLLQNAESNNNDIKWKRTPPLSRSKTLPDLLSQENEGFIPTFNKGMTMKIIKKNSIKDFHFNLDLPAPCKVFPKAPKIALTIDDMPLQQSTEFIRRKSSGSSVNSNASTTIEPHIYEFQESERHADSSLEIRLVKSRNIFTFYLHIPSLLFMRSHKCTLYGFTSSWKWW